MTSHLISDGVNVLALDLDDTLIKTYSQPNLISDRSVWRAEPSLRADSFSLQFPDGERMHSIKRPQLDAFLRYCFTAYDIVCVWTAGVEEYASRVVDNIFAGHRQPHYVFSREHCQTNERGDYFKQLNWLEQRLREDGLVVRSLLIIDDLDLTAKANHGRVIHCPPFSPGCTLRDLRKQRDTYLEQLLRDWRY